MVQREEIKSAFISLSELGSQRWDSKEGTVAGGHGTEYWPHRESSRDLPKAALG